MVSTKLLFRGVDRLVLVGMGMAAAAIGGLLAFDHTAAGQVWLRWVWPPLLLAGGLLNVEYGLRPRLGARPWAGTVLPLALCGRGAALLMGVVDGTAPSPQRAVALWVLWSLCGLLVAVLHLVYLPLPGVHEPPRRH